MEPYRDMRNRDMREHRHRHLHRDINIDTSAKKQPRRSCRRTFSAFDLFRMSLYGSICLPLCISVSVYLRLGPNRHPPGRQDGYVSPKPFPSIIGLPRAQLRVTKGIPSPSKRHQTGTTCPGDGPNFLQITPRRAPKPPRPFARFRAHSR